MDRSDRKKLNFIAEEMLSEARAIGCDRVYSATGYSRQNISIVHQQVRCANLAWALGQRRKFRKGDTIVIAGGSFSGLMLACSLAIAHDVIVYIVEKERRLLHRFLDKSQRYISPNLNSRDLGYGFSPKWAVPMYEPAIFEWDAGVASDVAMAWIREFDRFSAKLPIFTLLGCEVDPKLITELKDKVTIGLKSENRLPDLTGDLLIDATGFAPESNPLELVDHSYWEGGHRLIYDHLPSKCRVLISGCGDSGIIELMHYAFVDFRHSMVERFWPPNEGLEAMLDSGIERIKDVLHSQEVARYDQHLISEICWWLDHWWRIQKWRERDRQDFPANKTADAVFKEIESQLADRIATAFPEQENMKIDWYQREKFASRLSFEDQLRVRAAVASVIDEAISQEIGDLMKHVKVSNLLDSTELQRMMRPGVEVVLNGVTPTPFTRNLSTYNVWLTHVMMSLPNVQYRQGRIMTAEHGSDGKTEVSFADGNREIFDRVVTRYGPDNQDEKWMLTRGDSRDVKLGDFLLGRPAYTVPTDDQNIYKKITPPVDMVKKRIKAVLRRRGSDVANPLSKDLYLNALMMMPSPSQWTSDERYSDPQTWLSNELKAGRHPAYHSWKY